jgi:hypothetical protein
LLLYRAETEFDDTQEKRIIKMIKDVFGDKDIEKNWQMVKESLVNRDLVTVFDLNPASANQAHRDIDYAILQALLKGNNKITESEQSYKGKVKTHKYINRQNQSTTGKLYHLPVLLYILVTKNVLYHFYDSFFLCIVKFYFCSIK